MSVSIVRSSPLITRQRANKRSILREIGRCQIETTHNVKPSIRVEDLVTNRPISEFLSMPGPTFKASTFLDDFSTNLSPIPPTATATD